VPDSFEAAQKRKFDLKQINSAAWVFENIDAKLNSQDELMTNSQRSRETLPRARRNN
jgi:hypothetical protein